MKNKPLFLVLLSTLFITSCSGDLVNSYTHTNISYDPGTLVYYDRDEDMVVDGLEDDNYKNLESLDIYEPEYGVTLSTKTYFGKHGLYFYCKTDDKTVFYNQYENVDPYNNDSIEMHICVRPSDTLSISNMQKYNRITESMIQIRADVSGKVQTWVGNYHNDAVNEQHKLYVWTQYYKPIDIGVNVDGKLFDENKANGYAIELYCPYSNFPLLNKKVPDEICIMPAFNNANDDASRKWFTYKGMAHDKPSSWLHISKTNGINYLGKGINPSLELTATANDPKYNGKGNSVIKEVNSNNANPFNRVNFSMFLNTDGIYARTIIYDKTSSRYSDAIYDNDNIEIFVNTTKENVPEKWAIDNIYRFVMDVDGGVQTDTGSTVLGDAYPYRRGTTSKINVREIEPTSPYQYNYQYIFELFIPYESVGLTYTTDLDIACGICYKSPVESAYIQSFSTIQYQYYWEYGRCGYDSAQHYWCNKDGLH